jgi:hypothetical protein
MHNQVLLFDYMPFRKKATIENRAIGDKTIMHHLNPPTASVERQPFLKLKEIPKADSTFPPLRSKN